VNGEGAIRGTFLVWVKPAVNNGVAEADNVISYCQTMLWNLKLERLQTIQKKRLLPLVLGQHYPEKLTKCRQTFSNVREALAVRHFRKSSDFNGLGESGILSFCYFLYLKSSILKSDGRICHSPNLARRDHLEKSQIEKLLNDGSIRSMRRRRIGGNKGL
jgi:hypothetical protein